jgi:hypothetical protein
MIYQPAPLRRDSVMSRAAQGFCRFIGAESLGPAAGPAARQEWSHRIERIDGSDDVDIPMTPERQASCDAHAEGTPHRHRHSLWQASVKSRTRQ